MIKQQSEFEMTTNSADFNMFDFQFPNEFSNVITESLFFRSATGLGCEVNKHVSQMQAKF